MHFTAIFGAMTLLYLYWKGIWKESRLACQFAPRNELCLENEIWHASILHVHIKWLSLFEVFFKCKIVTLSFWMRVNLFVNLYVIEYCSHSVHWSSDSYIAYIFPYFFTAILVLLAPSGSINIWETRTRAYFHIRSGHIQYENTTQTMAWTRLAFRECITPVNSIVFKQKERRHSLLAEKIGLGQISTLVHPTWQTMWILRVICEFFNQNLHKISATSPRVICKLTIQLFFSLQTFIWSF